MKIKCILMLLMAVLLTAGSANGAALTTDEFDGTAVDPNVWMEVAGSGGSMSVAGGELTIVSNGSAPGIITKDILTYDYFKIRMKFSVVAGLWPRAMQNGGVDGYPYLMFYDDGANCQVFAKAENSYPSDWAFSGGWSQPVGQDTYHIFEYDARTPSATKLLIDGVNVTD